MKTQCVALTSRIRTAPTKHEVLVLYRVYNMEGVSIPYNRTGEAVYKITLKGLIDTTRDAGDRLFQWFREKGGVLATGATAGARHVHAAGSGVPLNLTAMGPVIASPLTAWTVGQHMVLGDASHCYWNGTAWATGEASGTLLFTAEGRKGPGNGEKGPSAPPAPAHGAAGQPDGREEVSGRQSAQGGAAGGHPPALY